MSWTTRASRANATQGEPSPGLRCVHCHRRCGTSAGGMARVGGNPLCSKPMEVGRPDCYRLVMYRFHQLKNCPLCADASTTSTGGDPACPQ